MFNFSYLVHFLLWTGVVQVTQSQTELAHSLGRSESAQLVDVSLARFDMTVYRDVYGQCVGLEQSAGL